MAQPPCIGASTSTRSASRNSMAGRLPAGTNLPLTAVATTAVSRPSSRRRSARVRTRVSRGSLLTWICIHHLREEGPIQQYGGSTTGHGGRQQKAVAVEAVDQHAIAL